MNSKQQAIEKAYGEYWEEVKNFVDENGFTKSRTVSPIDLNFTWHDIEVKDRQQIEWRPKSLQGIENNRGWIKIESEDDLPNEQGDYWVVDKFLETNPCRSFYDPKAVIFTMSPWYERYSHYQPIQKPQPPIY